MVRSVIRGIGPPKRSAPILMEVLARLPEPAAAPARTGPAQPRAAAITAVWWLLREIELAALTCDKKCVRLDAEKQEVTLWLPVSKTDPQGRGAARTHGCCCLARSELAGEKICPYHTLKRHLRRRCEALQLSDRASPAARMAPLFPTTTGGIFSKEGWVLALNAMYLAAETPGEKETRAELELTGHAARRGGAQFLAARGLPLFIIQLYGRWGSDTVLAYIEEAPLAQAGSLAARALAAPSLEEAGQAHRAELGEMFLQMRPEMGPEFFEAIAFYRHDPAGAYVSNKRNSIGHRVGPCGRRAVCGWDFVKDSSYDRRAAGPAPPGSAGPARGRPGPGRRPLRRRLRAPCGQSWRRCA